MHAFDALIENAFQHIGLPYLWGGDDPILGYDCSGLVQDLLKPAGIDPPGDQTAQGLHDFFSDRGKYVALCEAGCLLFFGKSRKNVTHVAFGVTRFQFIEAGGGGSRTKTKANAASQNAFVKLSHVEKRKDIVAIIMPDYSKIGMMY